MSDAFDVEAILEEQAARAQSSKSNEESANGKPKEDSGGRKDRKSPDRSADRSRDRSADRRRRGSRDRDRDRRRDSRDRRRRSPSGPRDQRKRSRSRDRRDRERERDRERDRERERERDKPRVETSAADREASRRQREIDDLTKDQRTLFVGQLVKKVTERNLEDFFSQIGKVRSVIMLRDKFTGQHKGFAYVEMAELESIPNCLLFNNIVPEFQKFPILVKASEAEKNYLAKKDSDGGNAIPALPIGGNMAGLGGPPIAPAQETRLYLGNIHTALDEVSLRAVLEQFGPLEHVKLQRDSMGVSKGYAFVKYISPDGAKMAMTALPSIELMGRFLRVGPVSEHTNRTDPLNLVASITDQNTNWKLDADDNGQGVAMDSTRRLQLMAKLGEKAGISVPVPMMPSVPQMMPGMPMGMGMPPMIPGMTPGMAPGMTPGMPMRGMVPPVAGMPSRCVRISNMFNPAEETKPGWDQDIKEDLIDQCANFGRVEHCFVDVTSPAGLVYFRMLTVDAAQKAANNLNGRFFAGRTIAATFLDENAYASLTR